MACRAPGMKWLMVMVFRVTMSSRGKESVADKSVTPITNCSASFTGALGSTGSLG